MKQIMLLTWKNYTKKHNLSKENLILLEETAVDYDLLHREEIIGVLYDTILKCHPKNNFTIGLNGKWGSGKTTIINNNFIFENEAFLFRFFILLSPPS